MSDTQPPPGPPADASSLSLTRHTAVAGVTTLVVVGDLDMTTYDRFCQFLMDEADRPTRDALALDLTGVTYTDAQTWRLIAQTRRQLTGMGRPLTVRVAPGGQPERVCRLLRLDRLVTLP